MIYVSDVSKIMLSLLKKHDKTSRVMQRSAHEPRLRLNVFDLNNRELCIGRMWSLHPGLDQVGG